MKRTFLIFSRILNALFLCGSLLGGALLVSSSALASEGGFFTGSGGVPIVPGMEEMDELGVVFDKPEGRIVEAFASGPLSQADVREFYGRALPQLGWEVIGEGLFVREGEVLKIEILEGVENSRSILRIILAPSQ
ncbi:hypothetical protein [Kiloniella sp. EL199]|uniref:hypothetical protein n=1 Tax=Kiloniella sp. EL199 TaxID=2107581 RepID=UPI0013C4F0B2|nr:hypothetical protein [Kiloniella sp. EL199]